MESNLFTELNVIEVDACDLLKTSDYMFALTSLNAVVAVHLLFEGPFLPDDILVNENSFSRNRSSGID